MPNKKRRQPQPNLTYHGIRCTVCSHPGRQAIEQGLLHWQRPADLALEFNVTRNAIYRHANALALFKQRADRTRYALGHIIEQAQNVRPTADDIIRAVRAHSCLDENGRWTEPPRHLIISYDPPRPATTPNAAGEIERAVATSTDTIAKSIGIPAGKISL